MGEARKVIGAHGLAFGSPIGTRHGQDFTERLLETCPDCIYVLDLTTQRSLYRNRKLHEMLGYADGDLECSQAVIPQQLMHPDDQLDPQKLITDLRGLAAGAVAKVEFRMRDHDGRWRHFCSRITPLVQDQWGDTTQILGMITDVSAQKWAEAAADSALRAAEQASAAKSQFLAQMSHEIRTPLGGIIGAASLLATTHLSPEQKEYTQAVTRTADAMQSIVDDVLDSAKIEAGSLSLKTQPFSFGQVTHEAMLAVASRAAAKGIALYYLPGVGVPDGLIGDGARLRQILVNLLANAVKFTRDGEIRVEAAVAQASERMVHLHLVVADTGIGVPLDAQSLIFDKYAQAEAAVTGCYGGTGLGLAICKQLAELMGGTIGLSSTPGLGSRFWVQVPFAIQDLADRGVEVSLAGRSALIVSDYHPSGEALRRVMSHWGLATTLQVVHAPGKAFSCPGGVDFVVVDRQLPATESFELDLFQESAGERRRTVLVTPLDATFSAMGLKAAAAGFGLCLPQPISFSRLHEFLVTGQDGAGPVMDDCKTTSDLAAGRKILVVDDNPDNRSILLRMVEKAGCHCQAVAGGREALMALSGGFPDLIFMDCQMPEMNGFEATRAIREHCRGAWMPIIGLTANITHAKSGACQDAGMDAVLAKPIRMPELHKQLDYWLGPEGRNHRKGGE